MRKTKIKAVDRFLALILAFIMVVGLVPSSVFASPIQTEKYTISVQDENGAAIEDATVTYNISFDQMVQIPEVTGEGITDGNGVVQIDLSAYTNAISEQQKAALTYTVTKDGYKTVEVRDDQAVEITSIAGGTTVIMGQNTPTQPDQVTVSVILSGKHSNEATVTLSGNGINNGNSITVNKNGIVFVNIRVNQGYCIKNLKGLDNTDDIVSGFSRVLTNIESDITITAEIVKEYNLSYETNTAEGGTVLINGNTNNSVTVTENSVVPVVITANENYQIASVVIDDVEQEIEDKKTFSKDITITKDTVVKVMFVQIYTVEVIYSGEGKYEITPSAEGGTVIVEAGEKVEIKAIPAENYRVEEVLINGRIDQEVPGENDKPYEIVLEDINENYTIEITFAKNIYNVNIEDTINGKVEASSSTVEHGSNVIVTIDSDKGYTMDTVTVNGTSVPVVVQDDEISKLELTGIASEQNIEVTFKEKASALTTDYIMDNTFLVRHDEENNKYIFKNNIVDGQIVYAVDFTTTKDGIRLYNGEEIIGGASNVQSVTVNSDTNISKIQLYYIGENELRPEWHDVAMDEFSLVYDKTPVIVNIDPTEAANKNGYHNKDVALKVSALDEGDSSGIKSIEYQIFKDSEAMVNVDIDEAKEISTIAIPESEDVVSVFETTANGIESNHILVSATEYNCENVRVVVRVTDYADNVTVVYKDLKINSTNPKISVNIIEDYVKEVDNLDYYNTDVTLEITVEDRADTFSAASIAENIELSVNGKNDDRLPETVTWEHDGNTHVGTLKLTKDAKYEFFLGGYQNLADRIVMGTISGVSAGKDMNYFVVDKTAPSDLKVTYSESVFDMFWETITFGFYSPDVTVTVEAMDETAGIEYFSYSYLGQDEESSVEDEMIAPKPERKENSPYQASFKIPAYFRGNVTFEAVDKAQNRSMYVDSEHILVVDDVAPGVRVAYEGPEPVNNNYYNSDRTMTIIIEEENFEITDVNDVYEINPNTKEEFLVITVGKVLDDGTTFPKENLHPEFVKTAENTYQAEIVFNENADYTFDIKYTDFSGNVYDSYEQETFTIDKVEPVIEVSYDNNDANNEKYFDNERKVKIAVTEHNFDSTLVNAVVSVNGAPNNAYTDYLKVPENWKKEGNTYTAEITFAEDGEYTFDISCSDLTGWSNEEVKYAENTVASTEFVVDKTNPSDLKITYSESLWDILIGNLTFGFYNPDVTVTVEAVDETAGIDYFKYSYSVLTGTSLRNQGQADITLLPDAEKAEGSNYAASFEIPAQFRGLVSFVAYDKSGNVAATADNSTILVVDDIAPGINVSYDGPEAVNGNYYSDTRVAKITINEANFEITDINDIYKINPATGEEYLAITVEKTLNDGTSIPLNERPEFTKIAEDTYEAEIVFDKDADYTFDIKYTDFSGNVYDEYEKDVFTIDKVKPVVEVAYDNNDVKNEMYFNSERKAIISIEEHNFDASAVDAYITVNGVKNEDFANYLKLPENWTSDGDIHTAEITFAEDGAYTFDIHYMDLAGYGNEGVSYGESKATLEFVVDKINPSDMKITYSESIWDILIGNLTFGFYNPDVTVTVEAVDETAGIDYFKYSYRVLSGTSSNNQGQGGITLLPDAEKTEGSNYAASFEIPAQFRGLVSFVAYDKSSNSASTVDNSKVLVVDDIAPKVKVSYEGSESVNGKYYSNNRTAKITIKEANFEITDINDVYRINPATGEGYLTITVEKVFNDGTTTTENVKPTFNKNAEKEDTYEAEILFEEDADYTFDIKYTDFAGNACWFVDSLEDETEDYALDYEQDEFTIDTTNPTIEVTYDNNEVCEEKFFKADRTATIVIREHNFDATKVEAAITAQVTTTGGTDLDKAVEEKVASYIESLKDSDKWESSDDGNTHTATIKFEDEAHYTFDIKCTDLANRANQNVQYDEHAKAPKEFTIDKTNPKDLDIMIGTESVLDVQETPIDSLVFNKFYTDPVTLKISANCDISGFAYAEYQKVTSVSQYKETNKWESYDKETGIVVHPSEKFIIYFKVTDQAGNSTIARSTGIIVDNMRPGGSQPEVSTGGTSTEKEAPEIVIDPAAPNGNGYYKDNVTVNLNVVDPKFVGDEISADGYCSGLNRITYRIYAKDLGAVEEGILYATTLNEGEKISTSLISATPVIDTDNLTSGWSGTLNIDAATFNSNNVVVEITAVDNAGNPRTSQTLEGFIRIDKTNPEISVTYDNNTADSATYFKNPRTATIVIKERNFNAEEVVLTINNERKSVQWSPAGGTGNQDDKTWTARIPYAADGDYTFSIDYTDLAGNKCPGADYGNSVAPTVFTIDNEDPVVTVSYDNNSAANGNYYKAARTATIVVEERNFDGSRVTINVTATDDGVASSAPGISGWSSSGTTHTATIHYSNDAKYTFDIDVKDKAGRVAADFAPQEFYVDKIVPTLTITGVENNSANNGDVIPVVSYSDTNFDLSQAKITLVGANRKEVALDGNYVNVHNGQTFTFNNFPVKEEMDDIYTLTATLTDKAGNTTTETRTFSVNRFGSTYALNKEVEYISDSYIKEPIDVVVTETNVNEITNIKVTLFKNNETIVLKEGVDYKVDMSGGNGQWYHYQYTIYKKNFTDDGVYRLTIHSEDTAGNIAENTLDTKQKEINFGVDNTKPTIVVTNLENEKTYNTDNLTVRMSIEDNLLLGSIEVYLDDYTTPYKVWSSEEIAAIVAENGEFTFDIPGDSTSEHNVRIVTKDAAGNEQIEEIKEFYVTTNIFVRYYNNKPLFFGSIAGVVLLTGFIIFLIYKKRKDEEESK